jgi:hypothetical protein
MLSSVKARSRTSEMPLLRTHTRSMFTGLFNTRLQVSIGEIIVSLGSSLWDKGSSMDHILTTTSTTILVKIQHT